LAFTDPRRFAAAVRFAVVRDPLDRLTSMMRHFRGAPTAGQDDVAKARALGLLDVPLEACVDRFLHDRRLRRALFQGTTAGRSGQSVSQQDYLSCRKQLLVPNLFSYSRLDRLQEWLRTQLNTTVTLPHANKSPERQHISFPPALEARAQRFYIDDYRLYEGVMQEGGVVTERDQKLTGSSVRAAVHA
jgi:hypothetical protein